MTDDEIAKYAKAYLEPIEIPARGRSYRCAARLVDDLYLPCVVIASKKEAVRLALRRFDETKQEGVGLFWRRRFGNPSSYVSVVESFVTGDNRLNSYDIRSLEPSPFAIPAERLREINSETSMGWTQFTATMADGKTLSFGTTFNFEFFALPEGYRGTDVVSVRSHAWDGGYQYRERPFFTCFVEGL